MQDVICTLINKIFTINEIGVEEEVETTEECPIIKVESIYNKEYYEANQIGYKPNLRLRISSLNYNNEQELNYMNTRYSIIRVEDRIDELILICERKIANEGQTRKSI